MAPRGAIVFCACARSHMEVKARALAHGHGVHNHGLPKPLPAMQFAATLLSVVFACLVASAARAADLSPDVIARSSWMELTRADDEAVDFTVRVQ